MRIVITTLLFCLISMSQALQAQNWSVSGGSGFNNQNLPVFTRQYYDIGEINTNGKMYFVSIHNHSLLKNLNVSAGILFNFIDPAQQVTDNSQYSLEKQFGYTLGAEYTWYKRGLVSLSSSLEFAHFNQLLSHNFRYVKVGVSSPTFHTNLAKVRVGKDLGAFAQVGYGIKGIFGIGIDYRFDFRNKR